MDVSGADNSVKIWRNLPISNPKPDLLFSMHITSLALVIYSSYRLETKIWVCLRQITVKIWRNFPISNPKPDLHNINAHTKFGENPLMFTQVIIRKRKTDRRMYDGRTDGQTHGCPMWNHNTLPLLCGWV